MKRFDRTLRRWFPKRYCLRGLRRTREKVQRQSTPAFRRSLPSEELDRLDTDLQQELLEWYEWLREIEDKDLVQKAKRLEIDLEEIPFPQGRTWHYEVGMFGNEYLLQQSRLELKKRVREAGMIRRNEKREDKKLIIALITAITGLVGTVIGLVALSKK